MQTGVVALNRKTRDCGHEKLKSELGDEALAFHNRLDGPNQVGGHEALYDVGVTALLAHCVGQLWFIKTLYREERPG